MGTFFLIAGCLVPSSLRRKGSVRFARNRALRLGLPAVLYAVLVVPLL
jgi:hypothetical protein